MYRQLAKKYEEKLGRENDPVGFSGRSGTLIRADTNCSTDTRVQDNHGKMVPHSLRVPSPNPVRICRLNMSLGAPKTPHPIKTMPWQIKAKTAFVWILCCTINNHNPHFKHPVPFAANSNPASDADPDLTHRYKQCCGSTLVSMRIQIQGAKPMRISDLGQTYKSQKVNFYMKIYFINRYRSRAKTYLRLRRYGSKAFKGRKPGYFYILPFLMLLDPDPHS